MAAAGMLLIWLVPVTPLHPAMHALAARINQKARLRIFRARLALTSHLEGTLERAGWPVTL
jgi:hypothetical protein